MSLGKIGGGCIGGCGMGIPSDFRSPVYLVCTRQEDTARLQHPRQAHRSVMNAHGSIMTRNISLANGTPKTMLFVQLYDILTGTVSVRVYLVPGTSTRHQVSKPFRSAGRPVCIMYKPGTQYS